MGFDFRPVRLIEKQDFYWKTEEIDWWSYTRYTLFKRFFYEESIETVSINENEDDFWATIYYRPKDIDKALEWVEKQEDDIKIDLIRLLEEMKKDSSIYYYCSI